MPRAPLFLLRVRLCFPRDRDFIAQRPGRVCLRIAQSLSSLACWFSGRGNAALQEQQQNDDQQKNQNDRSNDVHPEASVPGNRFPQK